MCSFSTQCNPTYGLRNTMASIMLCVRVVVPYRTDRGFCRYSAMYLAMLGSAKPFKANAFGQPTRIFLCCVLVLELAILWFACFRVGNYFMRCMQCTAPLGGGGCPPRLTQNPPAGLRIHFLANFDFRKIHVFKFQALENPIYVASDPYNST